MAVGGGPDDLLGAEGCVAAEEDLGFGALERLLVELGQAPFVELDAGVRLDPREGVLLADRHQDVVAFEMLVGFARWDERAAALGVVLGLDLLEQHAGDLAVVVRDFLRHQHVQDWDVLAHRVFLLPGRRLHLLEAGADDDLDVLAAQTTGGAAAIHGGVAAAQHDHALADLADMAERDRRQPVEADMDVGRSFLAARHVEIATTRGAGADEDRVVAFGQHGFHRVDLLVAELDVADIGDVAHFLVDHRLRETKVRDLGADEAAELGILVVDDDFVTEHGEIARHGERRGAAADAGDALAVLLRRLGHAGLDALVVLEVGGDALQATDRDRFLLAVHQGLVLDAAAPAGRLAGAVAGAPEDSREDVGLPVDHVGVGVPPVGDQPDIFGDRGVGGAGPLAVDDLVEVVRILDIGRLQQKLQAPGRGPVNDGLEYRIWVAHWGYLEALRQGFCVATVAEV